MKFHIVCVLSLAVELLVFGLILIFDTPPLGMWHCSVSMNAKRKLFYYKIILKIIFITEQT